MLCTRYITGTYTTGILQVYYRYTIGIQYNAGILQVYYRYTTGILQVYHVGLLGLGGTRIQGQPMLEVTTLTGAWALQLCEEDPCENCWKKLQGHTKSITHSHMFSTNFDMFQNSWLTPMATAWCVKSWASWCWAVQIAAWQFRLVLASLEYHWSWIVFLKPWAWCFIHIFRSWLETHTHTHMLWACFGKHWVCFSLKKTCCVYDIRWSKHSISCQGVSTFGTTCLGQALSSLELECKSQFALGKVGLIKSIAHSRYHSLIFFGW